MTKRRRRRRRKATTRHAPGYAGHVKYEFSATIKKEYDEGGRSALEASPHF